MKTGNRLQKLRLKLTEQELDGIFISQPENRQYLSGFDGSAGYLLITQHDAVLATDSRYTEQGKIQSPDYEIFLISNSLSEWFLRFTSRLDAGRLGFESCHLTFATYQKLLETLDQAKSPIKLVPVEGLVEPLRAVKEPEEIDLITKATEITDKVFNYLHKIVRSGMTEKELAWELEKFFHDNGSQGLAFETIVASGPNGAMPHAKPSERQISQGEPVVVDMGARFGDYASDMTRTFCLGTPDDTFKKVYDTVLGAQLTAETLIKDGMTGEEADRLARTVIEEAGYGEAFGHSLGHGVGLAIHEQPRLGSRSADILASGMVFTIEPGIYLPGWGGVRIEDTVLLDGGKVRVLSRALKT